MRCKIAEGVWENRQAAIIGQVRHALISQAEAGSVTNQPACRLMAATTRRPTCDCQDARGETYFTSSGPSRSHVRRGFPDSSTGRTACVLPLSGGFVHHPALRWRWRSLRERAPTEPLWSI